LGRFDKDRKKKNGRKNERGSAWISKESRKTRIKEITLRVTEKED